MNDTFNHSEDGVTVERREFLRLSLSMLAALTIIAEEGVRAASINKQELPLTLDELIEEIMPLAKRLVESPNPNEETYLSTLGARIERLDNIPRASFSLSQAA